jgi:alpha-tubulin suppressor-like RCC1 family protein/uncharacterized protein YjdB
MPGTLRSSHVLALLLALVACGDSTGPAGVASVSISPTLATLNVGENLQLTALTYGADNALLTNRAITWNSSNYLIARVSNTGYVTGAAPGLATITATSEGRSTQAVITIQFPVDRVDIDPPQVTLSAGQTVSLVATLRAANQTILANRPITWASSQTSVATVVAGVVTGVAPGRASITATSEARVGVTLVLVAGPVVSVGVTPTNTTTRIGGGTQLSATAMDASGTTIPGRQATWTSSSDAVATVSSTGLVTPAAAGSATISATIDGKAGSATVTVLPPVTLTAVAVGTAHSCAIDIDGVAYCWGANDSGQLGDATNLSRSLLDPVLGGYRFSAVSGGAAHSCGLTTGGAVYCWGAGGQGQLGNGSTATRYAPAPVSSSVSFVALAVGASHTCALASGGAAYCWGANSSGQLGDGTPAARSTPVAVSTTLRFASITAGGQHTCALTATGDAYCWGANNSGQIGNGTQTTQFIPIAVGAVTYTSLSAGDEHTCGVASTGVTHCWGRNGNGQLGDETVTNRFAPTPVSGGHTFASVSAGMFHTCAVTTSGSAFCWGANDTGELGDGTTTSRLGPVAVGGGLTFGSISATSGKLVSSGDYYNYYYVLVAHSCGVTTGRVVYCWGASLAGELGAPTAIADSPRPVKVAGQQ